MRQLRGRTAGLAVALALGAALLAGCGSSKPSHNSPATPGSGGTPPASSSSSGGGGYGY